MNWHNFVFSEKRSTRIARHSAFWMAWWIFYTCTAYSWWIIYVSSNFTYYTHPGLEKLGLVKWSFLVFIKSFFFLLIHLVSCYSFVYLILPGFLLKRNYLKLVSGILMIGVFLVIAGYVMQIVLFPLIDKIFYSAPNPDKNILFWTSVSACLLSAPKITAVATAIKLLKRWWLKQKEKERLEKEKTRAELDLLKAQIHPQFLFNSLNNIQTFALASSPKAAEMLLTLSDILSYMLYECNDSMGSLEKEIKMLNEYISLEKIRYGEKLEMNIDIKGNSEQQLIAPLLLLHFIENSFHQCNDKMNEQPWINMEIKMEKEVFFMKLINGKTLDARSQPQNQINGLEQARKRLQLIYPGKHELRVIEEEEIFMVNLQLELEKEHV